MFSFIVVHSCSFFQKELSGLFHCSLKCCLVFGIYLFFNSIFLRGYVIILVSLSSQDLVVRIVLPEFS